jgi:SAM-dependent methyltransferase
MVEVLGGEMIYSYKGSTYPEYLRNGNAVGHIKEIALQFCKGKGLDIGGFYGWSLPGSIPINICDNILDYDAYKIPNKELLDYVFSSHCLEHLSDPVKALEYWIEHIKSGGVLFLYLPHPDMSYWLPQNNKKHLHSWQPKEMAQIFEDIGLQDVLYSERDMYWSFSCLGFKR